MTPSPNRPTDRPQPCTSSRLAAPAHLLVALLVVAAALLIPRGSAHGEVPAWMPTPAPFVSAGVSSYRTGGCRCFDRWRWNFEVGLGLRWNRFVQLEGIYRTGGLWFPGMGHFPADGFRLGARSALTPENSRWWDDFYARAGYTRYSVVTARQPVQGAYLHPGWSLQPVAGLHIDQEIALEYNFGVMSNLQLGFQTVLGYRF